MNKKKIRWPNNAKSAVMITVNLDAEYFPRIFDPNIKIQGEKNFEKMGKAGMEIALPRLLKVLDTYNIKATFFVPGAIAIKYSKEIISIADKGHEIGCHGYEHEHMAMLSKDEQCIAILKGRDAIKSVCGKTPVGFRAPEGEFTLDTLSIARELGFRYSSSLSDNDIPYYNNLGCDRELLEIPIHWSLYDMPYFSFYFWPPLPLGQPRIACSDKVLNNWKWEYDGFHNCGGCYVLQLDPQCIGSQGKIYMLESILDYINEKGDSWYATGEDIANHLSLA